MSRTTSRRHLAVIVVEYDGAHPARLGTGPLAPPRESPIHYESFLGKIAELYNAIQRAMRDGPSGKRSVNSACSRALAFLR